MTVGAGPFIVGYHPAQVENSVYVNVNDTHPQHSLIVKHERDGKKYRYVKFDNGAGNVAPSAGGPAYWKDSSAGIVTADKTDNEAGAAIPTGCAGVFLSAVVTDQYYTWLLTDGTMTIRLLAGDSNGAVGNKIFAPASDADADFRSEADASVSAAEIPATELGRQMVAGAANLAECYMSIA